MKTQGVGGHGGAVKEVKGESGDSGWIAVSTELDSSS